MTFGYVRLETKKLTAALILDLSAAFDIVDHQILLWKLEAYNFSLSALSWFQSYLSDRFQVVQVESRMSDPKLVGPQRVPRGSLLSPILFLIFYNDFSDVRPEGASVVYADDDTDNMSDADVGTLQDKIQNEANLSTSWVRDNKMVCSGSKTKLMVVGTRELRKSKFMNMNKMEIVVDGFMVSESRSERLLGLLMNNEMTWEHHLHGNGESKGLIEKLSYRANLVYRLEKDVPKNQLKAFSEGSKYL